MCVYVCVRMCTYVCVHARAFIVLQYLVSSPGGGLTLPLRELLVSWGDDRTNFSTEDPGHTFHIGLDANMGLPFVLYCRVWALTGEKTNRYERRRMYVDRILPKKPTCFFTNVQQSLARTCVVGLDGNMGLPFVLYCRVWALTSVETNKDQKRRIRIKRDVYM